MAGFVHLSSLTHMPQKENDMSQPDMSKLQELLTKIANAGKRTEFLGNYNHHVVIVT